MSPSTTPRRVYEERLVGRVAQRLGLGPISLFDPDILAVHVQDRGQLSTVAKYLDQLVLDGTLRLWEPADPGAPSVVEESAVEQPWELVHPPAADPDE